MSGSKSFVDAAGTTAPLVGMPAAFQAPAFSPEPKPDAPDRQLLALGEVAALFGRSRRTVRWWIAEGKLPVVRVGRTPFVPSAALDRLINDAMDQGPNESSTINEIGGYHEEG